MMLSGAFGALYLDCVERVGTVIIWSIIIIVTGAHLGMVISIASNYGNPGYACQ